MKEPEHHHHEFGPVYDGESKILILGSFPSVKSREQGFYYGHPGNRFWKVISYVLGCGTPQTVEEKKKMLHGHHIALWDVIASCDIVGSSDSSICNVVVNDLEGILETAAIGAVYANGNKARSLYDKYMREQTGMEITGLPSTSPANASYSLERLCGVWKTTILQGLSKSNGKSE